MDGAVPDMAIRFDSRARTRLVAILLFWAIQFLSLTVQRTLIDSAHADSFVVPRLLVTAVGIMISLCIAAVVAGMRHRRWPTRLAGAAGLAVAATILHSAINFLVFQLFVGELNWRAATAANYGVAVAQWFWTYGCVTLILLALDYAGELRAARIDLQRLNGSPGSPTPSGPATAGSRSDIWVRDRGKAVRIAIDEVERISAERQYIRIHQGGRSYLHRASLTTVLPLLDPHKFIRIHRSHILARRNLSAVYRTPHGDYRVTTSAGEQLPVGRNYRSQVRSMVDDDGVA